MVTVLAGTLPWTDALFDFNRPFRLFDDSSLEPRSTLFPAPFTYTLYGASVSLRQKPISLTHDYGVSGGGVATAVAGRGLTVDGDGIFASGTIAILSQLRQSPAGATNVLFGLNLAVADFLAAAATRTTADDARLIRAQFSGDDLAGLSPGNDVFHAGTGRDLVFGNDGNDRVALGDGNDAAVGGRGADSLLGQGGTDILIGNEGPDMLYGGAASDLLDGGKGNDKLYGGADPDVFHFVPGDGKDTIFGFDPDADLINIGAGATGFDQLTLTQTAQGVRVAFADVTILVRGTEIADFSAADFRFVANLSANSLFQFDNIFDNFIKA